MATKEQHRFHVEWLADNSNEYTGYRLVVASSKANALSKVKSGLRAEGRLKGTHHFRVTQAHRGF